MNLIEKNLETIYLDFLSKEKNMKNIIIPFIKREIHHRIRKLEKKKVDFVIVDAPTLIENNLHKDMD